MSGLRLFLAARPWPAFLEVVTLAMGLACVLGDASLLRLGDDAYQTIVTFSLLPPALALATLGALRAKLPGERVGWSSRLLIVRLATVVLFSAIAAAALLPGAASEHVSDAAMTRSLVSCLGAGLLVAPVAEFGVQVAVVLCYWGACFLFGPLGIPGIYASIADVEGGTWHHVMAPGATLLAASVLFGVLGESLVISRTSIDAR